MARIAGVDLPRNKQAWVSLQYLHGIGPANSKRVLREADIDPTVNIDSLTEAQVNKLRDIIDHEYKVEGELRKETTLNIKRLIEIGSYRGMRHQRSLPVHGQSTRTNARTKRGTRKTVAGRGQKRGATKK